MFTVKGSQGWNGRPWQLNVLQYLTHRVAEGDDKHLSIGGPLKAYLQRTMRIRQQLLQQTFCQQRSVGLQMLLIMCLM
jgi:hypothetical protein